jgi:GNAT superfamily N-acetyltransferase
VNNVTQSAMLYRLERFYDDVPRRAAGAEPHGPLTLFVRRGPGWPYYARPTLGGSAPSASDVLAVRARQRELGVPEELEWVDEVTPGLAVAAAGAGLAVRRCPLMVLDPSRIVIPSVPAGTSLRFLGPGDAELAADIAAVAQVAFSGSSSGSPGSSAGAVEPSGGSSSGSSAGPAEREAARPAVAPLSEDEVSGLESGAIARAAIYDNTGAGLGALCSGGYQRAGAVAEIVGVATLPTARRRGLAGALTGALAARALDNGCELVFLSAGDDDVARVYERAGFARVGTSCLAERPPS